MNDEDAWQAHVDQLGAAARESNRRAIKGNIIARWIYTVGIVVNLVVAFWIVLTDDRFPVLSFGSIVFLALLAWGNEAMLRANRRRSR